LKEKTNSPLPGEMMESICVIISPERDERDAFSTFRFLTVMPIYWEKAKE